MRTATPTRTWRKPALVGAATAVALGLAASFGQAYAPTGRYIIDTETVTDTETGLIWEKTIDSASFAWDTAQQYCSEVEVGGSPDWRVPTVMELQTLIDETRLSPAIDVTVFGGTNSAPYWSSTPSAANPANAWYVNFTIGTSESDSKSDLRHLRCVR